MKVPRTSLTLMGLHKRQSLLHQGTRGKCRSHLVAHDQLIVVVMTGLQEVSDAH